MTRRGRQVSPQKQACVVTHTSLANVKQLLASARRSERKFRGKLFRDRHVLETHVIGQAAQTGRIVFAFHQRLQVGPTGLRDAETIRRDILARHFLLHVGDIVEAGETDLPLVGRIRCTHDGRHDRSHAIKCQFDGGLAQRVCLLDIGPGSDVAGGALQ